MKKYLILLCFLLGSLSAMPQELPMCGLCRQPISQQSIEALVSSNSSFKAAPEDWAPDYVIDFFAAFDPDGAEWALEKCGTIEAYAEHVLKSMNTVMYNSNIPAKFRLAGTKIVAKNVKDIPQGPSACLNDAELRAAVEGVEADVTLLFAAVKGSYSPISGNAFYLARPGNGYGCVHVKAGYESMTAIHEVGHIMGCGHSRDVDVMESHEYAVGAMRYDDKGNQYSTVMGYHGTLLPFFSSPDAYYKGLQMGSATEDNRRRIIERLPEIVRLGEPRTTYVFSEIEHMSDYYAHSFEVTIIEAPKAFFIHTDVDWLDTNPTMGWLDNTLLRVSVKYNETGLARVGHIVLVDADKDNPDYTRDDICEDGVITVIQKAQGGLVVIPSVAVEKDKDQMSDEAIFDITGRRLDCNHAAKGFYITSGRKVMR